MWHAHSTHGIHWTIAAALCMSVWHDLELDWRKRGKSIFHNLLCNRVEYGIYYWPQCIIGHLIFSTVEQISSSSSTKLIISTGNSSSDYSKTGRIHLFLPWREGLKWCYWPDYLLTDMDSSYENEYSHDCRIHERHSSLSHSLRIATCSRVVEVIELLY